MTLKLQVVREKDIRYRTKAKNDNDYGRMLRFPATNHLLETKVLKGAGPNRIGVKLPDKKNVSYSKPLAKDETAILRIGTKLPNLPVGAILFTDVGHDIFMTKVALDAPKIPATDFLDGASSATVCKYSKRSRHFITLNINGDSVNAQPRVAYEFRDLAFAMEDKYRVVLGAASSHRTCSYQCTVCKSICGNCGGCPGRCAAPGSSGHQKGLSIDPRFIRTGGHGYVQAYNLLQKEASRRGWEQFTNWNLGGSDPMHITWQRKI